MVLQAKIHEPFGLENKSILVLHHQALYLVAQVNEIQPCSPLRTAEQPLTAALWERARAQQLAVCIKDAYWQVCSRRLRSGEAYPVMRRVGLQHKLHGINLRLIEAYYGIGVYFDVEALYRNKTTRAVFYYKAEVVVYLGTTFVYVKQVARING